MRELIFRFAVNSRYPERTEEKLSGRTTIRDPEPLPLIRRVRRKSLDFRRLITLSPDITAEINAA